MVDGTRPKVLIVKIGAIGDVIMASAMVPAINEIFENPQVTWIVGSSAAEIVRAIDGVDRVIEIDDVALLRGNIFSRLRVIFGVWREILLRRYQIIVVAHSDRRYGLLTFGALSRKRRALYFGGRAQPIPGRWFPCEYVRLITGREGPLVPLAKFPKIRSCHSDMTRFAADGVAYVVIAPGGARNVMRESPVRRWPLANYLEITGHLLRDGYRVCIVGATSDRDLLESFKKFDVIDLCGRTSLCELVTVIGGAKAVLTHDSMPLHMSLLVGTPVVGIFGPTLPIVFARAPGDVNHLRTLWGGLELSCSPCYDGRDFAVCEDNVCMKNVTVSLALEALRKICK